MRYIIGEREDSTEMEEEEQEQEQEQNHHWFSNWEEQLPPPEKLTPLSQTLITPDLALAFNIPSASTASLNNLSPHHHLQQQRSTPPEFNSNSLSAEPGGGGTGSGGEEPARTVKRPRLVWTPQLHKRFVDAVAHLGIKNAVPKTIMQLMSVDGLTRENVASHLQKYRLYLKRMQGVNGGGRSGASSGDSATDRLFASSPVPPHFLHQVGGRNGGVVRPSSEQFFPYVPPPAMAAALHHHQQQQMMVGGGRQSGHFGSTMNGRLEHPSAIKMSGGGEDLESESTVVNGRKVLTLFPTADD